MALLSIFSAFLLLRATGELTGWLRLLMHLRRAIGTRPLRASHAPAYSIPYGLRTYCGDNWGGYSFTAPILHAHNLAFVHL
jgi:hypothetical protein